MCCGAVPGWVVLCCDAGVLCLIVLLFCVVLRSAVLCCGVCVWVLVCGCVGRVVFVCLCVVFMYLFVLGFFGCAGPASLTCCSLKLTFGAN